MQDLLQRKELQAAVKALKKTLKETEIERDRYVGRYENLLDKLRRLGEGR